MLRFGVRLSVPSAYNHRDSPGAACDAASVHFGSTRGVKTVYRLNNFKLSQTTRATLFIAVNMLHAKVFPRCERFATVELTKLKTLATVDVFVGKSKQLRV